MTAILAAAEASIPLGFPRTGSLEQATLDRSRTQHLPSTPRPARSSIKKTPRVNAGRLNTHEVENISRRRVNRIDVKRKEKVVSPSLTRDDAQRTLRSLASRKSLRRNSRRSPRSSSSSSSSSWSSDSSVSITRVLSYVRKNKWERLYAVCVRAQKEGERLRVDDWKDSKGAPALSIAAALNHVDTMLVLYGVCGASLEVVNTNGFTPLAIAVKYGSLDAVKTLIRCGASCEARNLAGDSPLVIAANQLAKAVGREDERRYNDYLEICFRLVQRGKKLEGNHLESFTREDEALRRIKSSKTKTLIKEWIGSRERRRDLHMPSMDTFRDSPTPNLQAYFDMKHEDLDFEAWAKIAVLLMFVYYDFVYGPRNVKLYLLLYVLAYAL